MNDNLRVAKQVKQQQEDMLQQLDNEMDSAIRENVQITLQAVCHKRKSIAIVVLFRNTIIQYFLFVNKTIIYSFNFNDQNFSIRYFQSASRSVPFHGFAKIHWSY